MSDGIIRLKRNHDYYVQVQGQLYCSNLDLKGIIFDDSCWHEYLPKIDYFFKRAFFPEMLTRRLQRGKLLYIHGGWIPYENYSCTSSGLKLTFQRAH